MEREENRRGWYTIKEFAEIVGVSVETVRHYIRKGLLTPVVDERNGYQYFSSDQICQMILHVSFCHSGTTISRIQEEMKQEGAGVCVSYLDQKISKYRLQMDSIQKTLQKLTSLREFCGEIMEPCDEQRLSCVEGEIFYQVFDDGDWGKDKESLHEWMEWYPLSGPGILFTGEELNAPERETYKGRPCIMMSNRSGIGEEALPPGARRRSGVWLRYQVESPDMFQISGRLLEPLFSRLESGGRKPGTELFGRLMRIVERKGQKCYQYYFFSSVGDRELL